MGARGSELDLFDNGDLTIKLGGWWRAGKGAMDSREIEQGDEEEEEETKGETGMTEKVTHGGVRSRSGCYHRRRR